jgi:hypothetical protein
MSVSTSVTSLISSSGFAHFGSITVELYRMMVHVEGQEVDRNNMWSIKFPTTVKGGIQLTPSQSCQ